MTSPSLVESPPGQIMQLLKSQISLHPLHIETEVPKLPADKRRTTAPGGNALYFRSDGKNHAFAGKVPRVRILLKYY